MVLYAVLMPMVLSRALDPLTFSAYMMGLQVVPFLLLLATPVQASMSPKFARLQTATNGLSSNISSLVALAARYFLAIVLMAITVTLALSIHLPSILSWDAEFATEASQSIRYLGIAAALAMPALIFTSYAAGNHNFFWENCLKCFGPYLGLVIIFLAWQLSTTAQSQLELQLVIGIAAFSTILGALFVILVGLRQPIVLNIRWLQTPKIERWGLLKESGGTYWWQVCALLSVGTGPFIVSSVDSASVAAYAIAVSTMAIITGVSTALTGPFTILIANSSTKNETHRLDLFRRFHDRFMMFILVSTIVVLAMPQPIFNLWLGETLGEAVGQLLIPLAVANFIRQITSPYTAAVLGLGQQGKIWLSPAMEAGLSIFLGLLLAHAYGTPGVAYALLIAAMVRLLVTLFHDLGITRTALPLAATHLLVPRVFTSILYSKK